MTKLTQQEIEDEVESFRKHISNPVSESIPEYISNHSVRQLLKIGDVAVSSALMAWIARAELAKEEKKAGIKSPSYQELKKRKENRFIYG